MKNFFFRIILGAIGIFRSKQTTAQRLHTRQEWKDLEVNEQGLMQLRELKEVLREYAAGAKKKSRHDLSSASKVLFADPTGTAKVLAASLLGKYSGITVYRVDLSSIVAEYIGETEKNLNTLFKKAEDNKWILFFDEADALFGRRTNVRDSHNSYDGREEDALLRRLESFPGPVILGFRNSGNINFKLREKYNVIKLENDN